MKILTNEELTFCVKALADALNCTIFFEQDKEKLIEKQNNLGKVCFLLREIPKEKGEAEND